MFECSVCKGKTFDNGKDYSEHLVSEEHLELDAKSDLTEEIDLVCKICDVKSSGSAPHEQHLKSKRHLKRIEQLKISQSIKENFLKRGTICSKKSSDHLNDMLSTDNCNYFQNMRQDEESCSGTSAAHHKQMWLCDVCRKSFPDSITFNDHFNQDDHMKNLRKCQAKKAVLQNDENSGDVDFSNRKELNLEDTRESLLQENLNTSDCDMSVFSNGNGTENILSENSFNSSDSQQEEYFCEICKVACSGIIPYSAHIKGRNHKREQGKQELLNKITNYKSGSLSLNHLKDESNEYLTQSVNKSSLSDFDATSPSSSSPAFANTIRCEICNVPCSGVIPYQQHISSQKHLKEIEKKKRYEEFKKNASTSGNEHNDFKIKQNECYQTNTLTNSSVLGKSKESDINGDLISFDESSSSSDEAVATSANIFICRICDISCTGIIPYTQHMSSTRHTKTLETKKLLEKYNKSKQNFCQTDVAECCANVTETDVAECCANVTETVAECCANGTETRQLMADVDDASLEDLSQISNHQIKNEQNSQLLAFPESLSNSSQSSIFLENSITCHVCETSCSGLIPFHQHLNSRKHLKSLEKKKILQTLPNNYPEKMQVNENVETVVIKQPSENESSLENSDSSLNSTSNSQDSYRNNFNNDEIMSPCVLMCDACKVSFTGVIPYNQHMKSNKHKKHLEKLLLLQRLQNSNSLTSKNCEVNQESMTSICSTMEVCAIPATVWPKDKEMDKISNNSNKMQSAMTFSGTDTEFGDSIIVLDEDGKDGCAKCGIIAFETETHRNEHFQSKDHLNFVSLKEYEIDSECSSINSSLSTSVI